jgi:hypothetical protein
VIGGAWPNLHFGKEFSTGVGDSLQAHYPFITSASFLGFLAGDDFGLVNGCFVVRWSGVGRNICTFELLILKL